MPDQPRRPRSGLLPEKIREGKAPREARRALKRRLNNVIYRTMLKDLSPRPLAHLLTQGPYHAMGVGRAGAAPAQRTSQIQGTLGRSGTSLPAGPGPATHH